MSFEIIEVAPQALDPDPDKTSSEEDGLIYSDLKRYLSKVDQLPAITVQLKDDHFVVVRGHKYLSIAQELQRCRIRAIISGTKVDKLEKISGFLCWIPKEQISQEEAQSLGRSGLTVTYHLLFFDTPPTVTTVNNILRLFEAFLRDSIPRHDFELESEYDERGPCLGLKFPTPDPDNKPWNDDLLHLLFEINQDYCRIRSYNGMRLPFSSV